MGKRKKPEANGTVKRTSKLVRPECNDFPAEYTNRIVCADCRNVLKRSPDNSVDCIITSPPYNFNVNYKGTDDNLPAEDYFHRLYDVLDECCRVLKEDGRLIINVQPLMSAHIPTHMLIGNHLLQKGMIWYTDIIWNKNHYNCRSSAFGSFKLPSAPYIKSTWEYVIVFAKGSLKHFGNSDDADMTKDEFLTYVNGMWSIAPERRMKEFGHPAMFPEELATRLIKLFTYKNDVVVDPFNGAGTTTLAAAKTGRRYLGVDVSVDYCATAQKRLDDIKKSNERRRNA